MDRLPPLDLRGGSFPTLARRVALLGTAHMMGQVLGREQNRAIQGKAARCIAPLPPNHGAFGYGGLCAESTHGAGGITR